MRTYARRLERDLRAPAATGAAADDRAPCASASARRLSWVPRCRQRLLPAPLGLGEPRWVDDARFDVAAHVVAAQRSRATRSARERFAELRDALLSTPLDRAARCGSSRSSPRLADGRARRRRARAPRDGRRRRGAAGRAADCSTSDGDEPPAPAPLAGRSARAERRAARARSARPRRRADVRARRATSRAPSTHPRATARSALRDAGRLAHALSQDLLPARARLRAEPPARPAPHARRSTASRSSDLRAVTRGCAGTRNDVGLAVDRRARCARSRSSTAARPSR